MINNIFIRKYDVAENKLTEAFIRFLACLETPTLIRILKHWGIKNVGKNITFDMQLKGENNIPDAVINSTTFAIHIEVKRTDPLRLSQLKRHAKFLQQSFASSKLLLMISPDSYEIETIKIRWRNSAESHYIMSRFISWTEIWHILQKLKKQYTSKDKFLLIQFIDYLKEEKVVIMTQGFQKKDYIVWTDFMEWFQNLDDMLHQEIKGYIKRLQPKWVYKSPYHRAEETRLHFATSKTSKYLHVYVGFYAGSKEKNEWKEPCFYIGWKLRRSHFKKLLNSRLFSNKEKKLKKKGFISWDPHIDTYKILKIKDIAKRRGVEKQKQYINKFLKDSIREFNKIKLAELI